MPLRKFFLFCEQKPIDGERRQREEIGKLPDRREHRTADDIDGDAALERVQIQLDGLRRARDVRHAQDGLARVFLGVFAKIGQHLAVLRVEEAQRAATERLVTAAHGEHAARPVQHRMRVGRLRLDVDRHVAVGRIHDRRQHEACGIGAGETAIAVD